MKKVITSSRTLWFGLLTMVMMLASQSALAEYVPLTALSGQNAYNSGSEGFEKLVDTKESTKWGTWFGPENASGDEDEMIAYVIVKADKAVVPNYYFLVTGNDTGSFPDRNWSSWKIYGGNFASDDLAVREGEGWTLIDNKESEPLPQANFGSITLEFDYTGTEAFQYYWIEITEAVGYTGTDENEIYLQMSEWGLGSYGEFQKYLKDLADAGTGLDEPVKLNVLEGTKMTGNESLPDLFDGDVTTKWGNGLTNRNEGETANGAYFIVKASRSMLPTYYALTTANDTQQYSGRNWKQWQIYGMNADSDEAVKRDSEGWVALDKKYNVGRDQLPAANFTQVFFTLSEGNETEYRYFKLELDQIMTNGDYMQMAEFALGDQYTLALDLAAIASSAESDFDPDLFAEKAQLDKMVEIIANVKACTDPAQLGSLRAAVDNQKQVIEQSAASYAELITARNQVVNAIDGGKLSDEAVAYLTAWISETDPIAPNDDYPVGNLAYIRANRQITGAEAVAEANRINSYLINNSETDPAIYVTYETIVDANGFNEGEYGHGLIDGDRDGTKWCANTSHQPWVLVFKAEEPIQPTYYGLVTGGDTSSYPGRNWKSWKIYAANFDEPLEPVMMDDPDFSSKADAIRNSDAWVLIDNKVNIGSDILHTESLFESYLYLSEGCAVPYEYFKIEVSAAGSGDLIQMNEFTFYNTGNLFEYREGFVEQFEGYDPAERLAYGEDIDAYKDKYEELQTTVNAPDVMKLKNDLEALQSQIEASADKYEEYEAIYEEIPGLDIPSESLSAWQTGYTTENVAPGSLYIRGTHDNIVNTETNYGSLDNDQLQAEIDYLQWIINAVDESNDCHYILLGGNTVSQFGDGFYGHLIDGIALNTTEMQIDPETGEEVEVEVRATKWGGSPDPDGNTYIIFRTLDKTNPFFYTLTTGNDAASYPGRNWGTWYIYGANFEGDGDATKDAEGWVLIDNKEDTGQDRLHPVNAEPSYFGFSTETTEEYLYYKVVVTKAYSGSQIQMNEIYFGTPEEFEGIKAEYTAAAQDFDTDVTAEQALIDEYEETIPEIEECTNMEALFRVNYALETLRNKIEASVATYEKYQNTVEEAKAYLAENGFAESEALTVFQNYLNGDVAEGPSELYPNGVAAYIVDEHVLADSVILDEIEFLESLKVAAVAAGYGPGMEITPLIVNHTFAKAGDMLKDESGNNVGREAEGWDGYIYRTNSDGESDVYAAEFCNVNAKFDVSQTLTDMKNGYYKVTLNAGYRANGDDKMLSYNYAAMAYANEIATYVPVIREGAAADDQAWKGAYADKQIYSADSTETYGWGIWGCEGAAHAFAQGRYAITMVAKVTDGTLTIGVKNEGTQGNEWTGVGNFKLWYLGEEPTAEALEEAAAYNAARVETLALYLEESEGTEAENYSLAPGFGAVQMTTLTENSAATYEAEKIIGETMQSIYETKKAYLALFEASEKVYLHWVDYASAPEDLDEAVFSVRDNLDEGAYADAEATFAAKDALYEAWPDYLQLKAASKVDVSQEDFTFDLVSTGSRPNLDLANIYEPLEKDETILAFDYTAEQDVENGVIMYNTPQLMTDVREQLATLPATSEMTTVYVNVAKGIKQLGFGTAVDHGIRWYINYNAGAEDVLALVAQNFRFITKAEMKAAGGKPLNGEVGDVNDDGDISIADGVAVLNAMAGEDVPGDADVNGDGDVSIADFVAVLNIMAGQGQ